MELSIKKNMEIKRTGKITQNNTVDVHLLMNQVSIFQNTTQSFL